MSKLKLVLYAAIGIYFVYSIFIKSDDSNGSTTEVVEIPTMGVETVLQEVAKDEFKISDENTVQDSTASTIIANYMEGTSDTFTLDEVSLMYANDTTFRSRSLVRAASYGMFGYMMGRNMSYRPSSSAYVDQKTYNKVNNGAQQRMRSSASRITKTVPGKSGFGKSSRSYGG